MRGADAGCACRAACRPGTNGALKLHSASSGVFGVAYTLIGANGQSVIRDADGEILADLWFSATTDLRGDDGYDRTTVRGEVSWLHRGPTVSLWLTRPAS